MSRLSRLGLTLGCALALASCSKVDNSADETAAAPPSPAPEAIPSAVPLVLPGRIPSTPAPHLAPDGVLYLTRGFSITINGAVYRLDAGTAVLTQGAGRYTYQGQPIYLDPGDVTSNLDLAARVGGPNSTAGIALAKCLKDEGVATPAPQQQIAAAPTAPAPPPIADSSPSPQDSPNPLDQGPYGQNKSIVTHVDQQGRVYHLGIFGQRIYQ